MRIAEGYLVYALAATVNPNLMVIGGHYRFTVSADGVGTEIGGLVGEAGGSEQMDGPSSKLAVQPFRSDRR